MALKIRLRRQGRTNRPFYRLVVLDGRCPREGRSLEIVGWYNPVEQKEELTLSVKADRVEHWLNLGAQLTDKAEALVAKAAPEVVKRMRERLLARKQKETAKKRAARRASA
ncbi:MAG: 30S ribosomal protein S16 [Verrucomicrobia bacterium]|nr:30S ribosomal protein S16 [Verrucomicrobiota bacterium]